VAHQQQRAPATRAFQPREDVGALGILEEDLGRNAILIEDLLDVVGRRAFAGAGVEPDQRLVETE
jgi:hypothetical protein